MFGLTSEHTFVCIMASIQYDNKVLFVHNIYELCIWGNVYLRYCNTLDECEAQYGNSVASSFPDHNVYVP